MRMLTERYVSTLHYMMFPDAYLECMIVFNSFKDRFWILRRWMLFKAFQQESCNFTPTHLCCSQILSIALYADYHSTTGHLVTFLKSAEKMRIATKTRAKNEQYCLSGFISVPDKDIGKNCVRVVVQC